MMRKLIFFFLLIFFFNGGCQEKQECQIDNELFKQYLNCIEIITFRANGGDISFNQISKSYRVLKLLTRVESKVVTYNDIPYFYEDKKDLESDLSNWKAWYDKHKCSVSIEFVKELIKKYNSKIELPDYKDSLEISRLRITFPDMSIDSMILLDEKLRKEDMLSFPSLCLVCKLEK